jgi:hypothetical protein
MPPERDELEAGAAAALDADSEMDVAEMNDAAIDQETARYGQQNGSQA